ncbi:hypothetical protein F4861DRAFT_539276 [Xylaria intraflava]|nr:hypothetical protein F4861DRAFT_539276 [Xylaria intraflava]
MSSSDSIGGVFKGVNIFLISLAAISVLLRCYVRIGMINSFGADDFWMLVTLASFTANTTVALISESYGLGQHVWNLSPENVKQALKFSYATEITYGLTMILVKISIACYLLRITPNKVHKRIIYFVTVLTGVVGLTLVLIVAFQCKPPSRVWDDDLPGSCLSFEVINIVTYVYSGVAILTDFTFTLLPVFIVWNLQMNIRNKIALIPIFSLALLASLAVVIRIPLVKGFTSGDFLFSTGRFAIWSAVEQGLAITAGSWITLRPLLAKVFDQMRSTRSAYTFPLSDAVPSSKENRTNGSRAIDGGHDYWNRQDRRVSDDISLRAFHFTRMEEEQDNGLRMEPAGLRSIAQ